MANKKTRAGNAWKQAYTAYKMKSQCEKNRTRKLEAHKKANPNDTVAAKAKVKYRRKKPLVDGGWVTGKVLFGMMDYVGSNEKGKPVPYIGMRSKGSQKKMAQYMKLSRKTANEMQYTRVVNKKKS